MGVYLLTIVICCGFSWFAVKQKSKDTSYYILAAVPFLALFIVSGIRYEVGRDYTDTYVYIFNQIKNNVASVRVDVGMMWLCEWLIKFGFDVQWLFVITSFMINWYVCKSMRHQSSDQVLSCFIYICGTMYFFSMNGVRQSISMAIFYYSLEFVKDKNLKKYLVYNIIGCLFHQSAIVFLPLYFVLSKKLNKKIKYAAIIALYIYSELLLPHINEILMGTKYAMYLTNGAYSALETLNVSTILNIGFMLWYDWFVNAENEKDVIYSNCHFMGVIVSIFMTSIPLAMRLFVSFRYIEYLSMPNLLEKYKYNNFLKLGVVVLYFVYFIHGVYIENGNTVLPYKTIFSR